MLDAIVVGLGSMGAPAAAELARRGRRVLGLERSTVPNESSSHHGRSRMVRLAYAEHPDYVPLLRRSLELWHALNAATGEAVFHRTGGLYIGARPRHDRGEKGGEKGGEMVEGSLRAAREHSLPHEHLSAAEVRARVPGLAIPDSFHAMLEPEAGYVVPERAVEVFAERARSLGARLLDGQRVNSWREADGVVEVEANGEIYRARSLVIAAGARSSPLLEAFAPRLRVTRQVLAWFEGQGPTPPSEVWAIDDDEFGLLYGFPFSPREPGLKAAIHRVGEAADPEAVDRVVREADLAPIRGAIARYFPGRSTRVVDASVCLYTNSPDSHFIVDRVPGTSRVFAACGFSGHGFKFAPVMGEILADLAEQGETGHPIGFLSASRWHAAGG